MEYLRYLQLAELLGYLQLAALLHWRPVAVGLMALAPGCVLGVSREAPAIPASTDAVTHSVGRFAEMNSALQAPEPFPFEAFPSIGRDVLAMFNAEQYDKAVETLDRMAEAEPPWPCAVFSFRGFCKELQGDLNGAIEDYDRAIDLSGSALVYERRGALRFRMGDVRGAEADLTKALERSADGRLARSTRALLRVSEKRWDDAISDILLLVATSPSKEDYQWLGSVLERAGRHDEALDAYSRAIAICGSCPDSFVRRALCFESLGAWSEADTDYSTAIQIDPRHPVARSARAMLRSAQQRHGDALKDFAIAIALRPHHIGLRFGRALTLLRVGHAVNAERDFSWVIARDPSRADAYWFRAHCFINSGNLSEAAADLESAGSLYPTGSPEWNWAIELRARLLEDLGVSIPDRGSD